MADIPPKYQPDFGLLVAAAVAGERCPANQPFGSLQPGAVARLAHAGAIRSEVFAKNFRRVTILVGEHRGKTTANPPSHYAPPYKVIGG